MIKIINTDTIKCSIEQQNSLTVKLCNKKIRPVIPKEQILNVNLLTNQNQNKTINVSVSTINPIQQIKIEQQQSSSVSKIGQVVYQYYETNTNQIIEKFIAGEQVKKYQIVRLNNEDNRIYIASAEYGKEKGTIGLALNNANTGDDINVLLFGYIELENYPETFIAGNPIYLGIDGQITQKINNLPLLLNIGYAIKANSILITINYIINK